MELRPKTPNSFGFKLKGTIDSSLLIYHEESLCDNRITTERGIKKGNRNRFPYKKWAATYFSTGVPEVERRESLLSLSRCRDVGEANKCSIIGDVRLLPGSAGDMACELVEQTSRCSLHYFNSAVFAASAVGRADAFGTE